MATSGQDELRARFTTWMNITIYRARLAYLKKECSQIPTISLEEISESKLCVSDVQAFKNSPQLDFEFENDWLESAYGSLSVERQMILRMLYIDQMKPGDIAVKLHCSTQHVYDQRYQSLKTLKKRLAKGGKGK